MLVLSSEPAAEIRHFRADPWHAQRTFKTPLKDLERFVRTLLTASPIEAGYLATDQVVFEPDNLLKLMAKHSMQAENVWQLAYEAQGGESIAELLEAALGDWVDFCFVSASASMAIYADHDEYVTFYAGDESTMVKIASRLEEAGFSPVADYVRPYCG